MLKNLASEIRRMAAALTARLEAKEKLKAGVFETARDVSVRPRPRYSTRIGAALATLASDVFPQMTNATVRARVNGIALAFYTDDDAVAEALAQDLRRLPSA